MSQGGGAIVNGLKIRKEEPLRGWLVVYLVALLIGCGMTANA